MAILETTSAPIAPADPLNAIVARYPQTLPVLQRFGLDTCCGGALPLRTAAEHHNLDLDELIAALRTAVAEGHP
jgi:regulator of cell morphogenesis and NO signaling